MIPCCINPLFIDTIDWHCNWRGCCCMFIDVVRLAETSDRETVTVTTTTSWRCPRCCHIGLHAIGLRHKGAWPAQRYSAAAWQWNQYPFDSICDDDYKLVLLLWLLLVVVLQIKIRISVEIYSGRCSEFDGFLDWRTDTFCFFAVVHVLSLRYYLVYIQWAEHKAILDSMKIGLDQPAVYLYRKWMNWVMVMLPSFVMFQFQQNP